MPFRLDFVAVQKGCELWAFCPLSDCVTSVANRELVHTWHTRQQTEQNTIMQQLEFFTIPSPCIGVCEANNRGYCKGCLRSRDERLYWLEFDAQRQREIIRLCQLRKARIREARLSAARGEQQDVASQQGSLFGGDGED